MSGSWFGNMRAPRVKASLLMLLLLLTALTGTVFCQDDDDASKEPRVTVDQELESNTTDAAHSGEEEDAVTVDEPEKIPVVSRHGRLQTVNNTTSEPSTTDSNKIDEDEGGSGSYDATTKSPESEQSALDPIIIIIPVALVVLIICIIVCCIFTTCKWNKKKRNPDLSKEDPYLDESSTEKVPMPMFEEDVPSVLELEMEELDQWMKKDGETTEDSKHV